jgi:hypothetical protein
MANESLTVEILKQIRADLAETSRAVHARLDRVEERQATSDQRLEATQSRLVEAEIRLATELVMVSKTMGEVRDLLRDRLDQRDRVDDHEKRLHALEHKPARRTSRSK